MERIAPVFGMTAALLLTAAMFAASNPPRFYKPQQNIIYINLPHPQIGPWTKPHWLVRGPDGTVAEVSQP